MFLFRKNNTTSMDYIAYFKSLPSTIVYVTDEEYRNAIRVAMRFQPDQTYTYNGLIHNINELDEQTRDECLFDSSSITTSMNILYEHTNKEGRFHDIYIKAAGQMLSTSPDIGHAVVCSYDTFTWYYTCVWHYLHGGISSLIQCTEYEKLRQHFGIE